MYLIILLKLHLPIRELCQPGTVNQPVAKSCSFETLMKLNVNYRELCQPVNFMVALIFKLTLPGFVMFDLTRFSHGK